MAADCAKATAMPSVVWRGPLVPNAGGSVGGRRARSRRRLIESSGFGASANKVWLWALDPARYPVLYYLDLYLLLGTEH